MALAGAPSAWYSMAYEPNDIEVVRRKIAIRKLPSRLEGLTAVQISDLHINNSSENHQKMVDMVRPLRPDVIFFTGDLVNDPSAIGTAHDIFSQFHAPLGTWAVLGNSDHSSDVSYTMPTQLKSAGVNFLVNQNRQLESGLWLVGSDDPSSAHDDMGSAMNGVAQTEPRILLTHSPDIVNEIDGLTFDLILAGHTHGGQVNLPIFNGAWLLDGPAQHYIEGLYEVNGSPMYVNRGIGTAKLPIRVGARPEITHFTFHAA